MPRCMTRNLVLLALVLAATTFACVSRPKPDPDVHADTSATSDQEVEEDDEPTEKPATDAGAQAHP